MYQTARGSAGLVALNRQERTCGCRVTLEPQDEYDLYDIRDLEQDPEDGATMPQEPLEHSQTAEPVKEDRRGWLRRLLRL